MSTLVDERIVEMKFDNSNFEKNTKETMNTIQSLKASMNFDSMSNSINKAVNSIDMNPVTYGLEKVSSSFSAWEIAAISVINNITNRVTNLGIRLVESLSVDNINSGWLKYAENTKSVGTLLAQDGNTADSVTAALEKLMWFTDQTSYSYTDMVSNISKFTATGQNLEDSVQAMMGIANWAALSGQNAATASRAMYQLSQAMGQGTVKLMDYKSIQNANMDTAEFRENALKTAVDLGYLIEKIEGVYVTTDKAAEAGKEFSQAQFTTQLSSGWFSSEVLMETLSKYSKVVDKLYEDSGPDGPYATAAQAIEAYEQQLEETGTEEEKFGLKAFKSAQEARTFEDVINATKDAVSSGWLSTFDKVFGDYNEAKKLWTDLADELWDVFAAGGEARNNILTAWKNLGGREDIFNKETGAFWNLFYAIKNVVDTIKSAWKSVFGFGKTLDDDKTYAEEAGAKLKDLTSKVRDFNEKIRSISDNTMPHIYNILRGIFSVGKLITKSIGAVYNGIKPVFSIFGTAGGTVLETLGKLGEKFANFVDTTTIFATVSNKISMVVWSLVDSIKSIFNALQQTKLENAARAAYQLSQAIGQGVKESTAFAKSMKSFATEATPVQRIFAGISAMFDLFLEVATALGKILTSVVIPAFVKFASVAGGIISKLASAFIRFTANVMDVVVALVTYLKTNNRFQNAIDKIIDTIKRIPAFFAPLLPLFKAIGKVIFNLIELLVELPKALMRVVQKISGSSIGGVFKTLGETITGAVKAIGNALSGFKDIDSKPVDEFTDEVTPKVSPLQSLFKGLKAVVEGLWNVIKAVMPVLGAIFELIGQGLQYIAKSLNNTFGNKSPMETIKTILSVAFWAGVAAGIYNIIYIFRGFVDSIALIFDGLGSYLDSKAMMQYAEALKTFAIAILLIVASLVLISSMNAEQLAKSLTVLTILITGMMLVMKAFSKMFATTFTSFKQGILGFGAMTAQAMAIKNAATLFLSFAGAIIILVLAMKMLANMSYDQITNSLVALVTLVSMMVIVCKILSSQKKVLGGGALGLVFFAIAINKLVKPVQKLSDMPEDKMMQGLKALGILLLMVVAVAKVNKISSVPVMLAFATYILSLSVAFTILASTMSVLSLINQGKLWSVVGVMASLLAVFTLVAKVNKVSDSAKLTVLAGSLIILGVAFAEIATSIAILSVVSIEKAWNAVGVLLAFTTAMVFIAKLVGIFSSLKLLVFATGMLELGKAMAIFAGIIVIFGSMEEDALKRGRETIQFFILAMAGIIKLVGILSSLKLSVFATGMILLGVAMMEFATVIAILGSLKTENLLKGSLAIAGMVALLALLSKITSIGGSLGMNALATSLVILSAGMLIFAAAMAALGAINLPNLVKGFITFALAMGILVAASKIIGPSVITLLALGAALTMISTAMLAFAAALALITGLGAGAGLAIRTLIKSLADSIIELGPTIAQALEVLITSLVSALNKALTGLFELIYGVVDNLLVVLNEKGPQIITTIIGLLSTLLETLADKSPEISNSLVTILISVLDALVKASERIFQDVLNLLYKLIDVIVANMPTIMDKLYILITTFIDGIVKLITQLVPRLVEAGFDLIIGLIDGVGEAIEKNASRLRDAMLNFCKHMWNAFLNFFGIHSPSTKAEGAADNIILGILKGIGNGIGNAVKAMVNLGKKMFEGIAQFTKKFLEWGKNIIQGIWNGIKAVWNGFWNFWKGLWDGIVNWFKNLFGIHSPSKLFYGFGQNTVEGYENGLDDGKNGVYDTMEDIKSDAEDVWSEDDIYNKYGEQIDRALAESILNNSSIIYKAINLIIDKCFNPNRVINDQDFKDAIANLLAILQNEIDENTLVITPVVDLSEVHQGLSSLKELYSQAQLDMASASQTAQATSKAMQTVNNGRQFNSNSSGNAPQSGDSYNVVFNITGSDPKAIAEEVDKTLQEFIERGRRVWE